MALVEHTATTNADGVVIGVTFVYAETPEERDLRLRITACLAEGRLCFRPGQLKRLGIVQNRHR